MPSAGPCSLDYPPPHMNTPFHFSPGGDAFHLTDPHFLEQAGFDLWNDSFCLKGDQAGRVEGHVFTPNAQPYADGLRPVYCVDVLSGQRWSLGWGPVFQEPNSFSFGIHLDHLSWQQGFDGIASELSVSVPRRASLEAWRLHLINQGKEARTLEITLAVPTGLLGLLSQESAVAEDPFGLLMVCFPYYVKIPDYAKMASRWNTTFLFPDKPPESWTCLERDFLGNGGWQSPAGLGRPALSYQHCHYERGLFGLRYRAILSPGARFELGWIMGPSRDPAHAGEIRRRYPPHEAFARSVEEQAVFRKKQNRPLRVSLPDQDFAHYLNHWAPDRSIRIGRTYRFNPSPQARNAIQDSMALAFFDPDRARLNLTQIWRHQDRDGFMPHGLPMQPHAEVMPITLIPHKDTNVWGPLALDVYLRETHDLAILETPVPFRDHGTASLADHLELGLRWLLADRTPRGLSRIGQGDWNDPLNMAGPDGRGESVWLTEALAYAAGLWASICRRSGRPADEWDQAAGACRQAVREHAWDGDWFIRAISDEGSRIGSRSNAEGALFLNAQSWALLAGIPDQEQTARILRAVDRVLGNRIAPAVLGPPYRGMQAHVGKLTLKSPGTGENGSVYCHAALFWSYALLRCGQPEAGWRVLRNLVPGSVENPVQAAGQVPLFIPNFYRGPVFPEVFGRSSQAANTGSAAWIHLTCIEEVLGLKADGTRLLLHPRLPRAWDRISGERRFRGSRYRFTMERRAGTTSMEVEVDGERIEEPCIPWKAGADCSITILLPSA